MLELILSNHERKCLSCVRSQNCELQDLAKELGVDENRFEGENIHYPLDNFSPSIVRDPNKCILCRRCVAVCRNVQKIGAIGAVNRGFKTVIAPAFGKTMLETDCVFCGQCINACPVGALRERDDTDKVWDALSDPEKFVVVQPAPAVRVALGEEFGLPIGTRVTGKMTQALRRLGFDKVFDTDFGADLTIMEEATELLGRIQSGGVLPMFTSCSPGWVKYLEHHFPEMIPNMSTCKSPMEMEGAVIKTYYAEKTGIDPANIVVVAVMPCTSKKFEAQRPEMVVNGMRAVDVSLTTRELARMIRDARIDFARLPDEECFDELVAVHRRGDDLRHNRRRDGGGAAHRRRRAGKPLRGERGIPRGSRADGHQGSDLHAGRQGAEGGRGQQHRRGEGADSAHQGGRRELCVRGSHGLSGRLRQRRRPADRFGVQAHGRRSAHGARGGAVCRG